VRKGYVSSTQARHWCVSLPGSDEEEAVPTELAPSTAGEKTRASTPTELESDSSFIAYLAGSQQIRSHAASAGARSEIGLTTLAHNRVRKPVDTTAFVIAASTGGFQVDCEDILIWKPTGVGTKRQQKK
jgi:hypothetical protein